MNGCLVFHKLVLVKVRDHSGNLKFMVRYFFLDLVSKCHIVLT